MKQHFFGPYTEYGASGVQIQWVILFKRTAQNRRERLVSEVFVHFICACFQHCFEWVQMERFIQNLELDVTGFDQ